MGAGELAAVIRDSGLIPEGSRGVVMVSGGPDSGCAAAGLVEVCGAGAVTALHVNYGLRPDSDADEQVARELCGKLGIEIETERPRLGEGNLQDEAREARYGAAERLRERLGADWIATGHTRSDLVETVIYRLVRSPGRRALLGMPARRGRLVRPLLAIGRDRARELAEAAALPFRDDPSNADPGYARNRIRNELLPVLRELGPAAERTIAATHAELTGEAELLERLAAEALAAATGDPNAVGVRAAALADLDPVLRRLALRQLAGRAAGRKVPLGVERAAELWRLAQRAEGGELDLGSRVRAVCKRGTIGFDA